MAKNFLYLILAFALLSSLSPSIKCSDPEDEDNEDTDSEHGDASFDGESESISQIINPVIVNGRKAKQNDANYIVQVRTSVTSTRFMFCGGSLLNSRTVITAGHCIKQQLGARAVKIRYGTKKMGRSHYKDLKVKSIHVHPNYRNGKDDIAIIKLAEDAENGKNVKFVRFDQKGMIEGNENVMIYGWGRLSGNGRQASKLQKLKLKTMSRKECHKHTKVGVICARASQGIACMGDSGGPMVYNGVLVGIASQVQSGCRPGGINMYTRVSSYTSFIKKYMH